MPGFATKEGHPQERKFLRFFSPAVGIGPCISSEFELPSFLLSQFQLELPHTLAEAFKKGLGIRPVLKTRQEIIGKRAR